MCNTSEITDVLSKMSGLNSRRISRLITSHPISRQTLPTQSVPEKSSRTFIVLLSGTHILIQAISRSPRLLTYALLSRHIVFKYYTTVPLTEASRSQYTNCILTTSCILTTRLVRSENGSGGSHVCARPIALGATIFVAPEQRRWVIGQPDDERNPKPTSKILRMSH